MSSYVKASMLLSVHHFVLLIVASQCFTKVQRLTAQSVLATLLSFTELLSTLPCFNYYTTITHLPSNSTTLHGMVDRLQHTNTWHKVCTSLYSMPDIISNPCVFQCTVS